MLTVKDFLLLICAALGAPRRRASLFTSISCHARPCGALLGIPRLHPRRAPRHLVADHCGYRTASIRELLLASRARYHELLAASAAAAVKAAAGEDALAAPLEVAS